MTINLPLKVDNLFCTPVYSLLMPTFLNQVNKINKKERGANGFGSTGLV